MEAIDKAIADGCVVVGITNQGGVKAGFKSLTSCIQEQRYTLKLLKGRMKRIYFCPDDGYTCITVRPAPLWLPEFAPVFIGGSYGDEPDDSLGGFRKPDPGMILKAMRDFRHFPDLIQFEYVGDRDEDAHAALNAGVSFRWAQLWRGEK